MGRDENIERTDAPVPAAPHPGPRAWRFVIVALCVVALGVGVVLLGRRQDTTTTAAPITTVGPAATTPVGSTTPKAESSDPSFTPQTTVPPDPAVYQAQKDLHVKIDVGASPLVVGETSTVTVTVENTSPTAAYRAHSCFDAVSAVVSDKALSSARPPGSLVGTPGPEFQTDGEPLRRYLAPLERSELFGSLTARGAGEESWCKTEEVDGGVLSPPVVLGPGASIERRFDVDLASLAPFTHAEDAVITAGFDLPARGWTEQPVRATARVSVAEPDGRERSYVDSVETVGSNEQVLAWVKDHQGPLSSPLHGVHVEYRYLNNAWTFTFSGSKGDPPTFSRLVVVTDPGGHVLTTNEAPAPVAPRS